MSKVALSRGNSAQKHADRVPIIEGAKCIVCQQGEVRTRCSACDRPCHRREYCAKNHKQQDWTCWECDRQASGGVDNRPDRGFIKV